MTVLTANRLPVAFILSEGERNYSRDAITIAASQDIEPGQLLGKRVVVANATSVPSAAAGNTGNATIAMGAPALTSKAKDGRYKGIAITATTVRWEDPAGVEIGVSTHGASFAKGGIKITITAGGNANVAGDEFYVDVGVESQGDFEYVAWDPDATDGSEVVAALPLYAVKTGAGETKRVTGFVRQGEVNGHEIVLPTGVTTAETAKAYSDLADIGIIVRN